MNGKDLLQNLDIEIVNEKKVDKFIDINAPGIYRAGLELHGFSISKSRKNIIIWGTKENNWFKTVKEEVAFESIERVVSSQPPLLILSIGISKKYKDHILKICNKHKVPLAFTQIHVSELASLLSTQLVEEFAPRENIHASLVEIDGIGVMIKGKSGIGKSEAVVELIQAGYNFISDDTVTLKRIGNRFIGTPAEITQGFLEVRGLGLIDVPYIYGARAMRDKTEVQIVIELTENNAKKDNADRLGLSKNFFKVLGGQVPLIKIPVKEGKSVTSLIIASVNLFLADKKGHNPLMDIKERIEGNK